MTGETEHHRHCQVNYRNGKSRNSLWRLKRQKQTVNDRRPYLSLKNQLFGEQHGFLTVGFCHLHPTWHVSRPSGALNTCIHKESEIRLFYVTSIRSMGGGVGGVNYSKLSIVILMLMNIQYIIPPCLNIMGKNSLWNHALIILTIFSNYFYLLYFQYIKFMVPLSGEKKTP